MKKYDSSFANALKFVRKIRSSVCPNLGFELQLKKYQEKLSSERSIRQAHLPKEVSQQEDSTGRNQVEAKQMLLTFNAPTKDSKDARMAVTNSRNFNGHTPILSRKGTNASGVKKNKAEEETRFAGGLFIEGRAAGELKSESMYDPEKYWYKGAAKRKEKSFKA